MPLSSWGGFARGLSEGLRNVATIQNIQSQRARDELAAEQEARSVRAEKRGQVVAGQQDTLFKQGQEEYARKVDEYNRLHARNIDPNTVIDALGLDDEGRQYVNKAVKPFLPAEGKVSLADIQTIQNNVMKDPAVVSEIRGHRLRALGKQISSMEEELQTLGSESGGLAQVGIYNQKKALLDQAKARMQELDPNYFKREELKVHQKNAEKVTVSNLPAMRDKLSTMPEGLAKEAYRRQIKEQEDFELNEKRVAHENELEKARILAGGRTAAQEAKEKKDALTQRTNTVNKFYSDLEKSTKERIKELAEDPTEANSVKEYQKILTNIQAYRTHDLDAVQKGTEPPNMKNLQDNWMAGPKPTGKAGPVTAKAPSRFTVKEVTEESGNAVKPEPNPKKAAEPVKPATPARPTFENRKSAMGVNTGGALRDMVGVGGPQERLMAINRDLKAGLISKEQYEKYKQEILADIEGR